MNKLFELFEAERPVITEPYSDYDIGYNNGLVMAQAIVLKRDVEEVVRCKDCKHYMLWEDSEDKKTCAKSIGLMVSDPDDFCSYGERRTDD